MDFYEGDNIGGIATIQIAHHTDFSSFNPAVFTAGKNWLNIPFVPEKARLSITHDETENGNVYTYTGDFTLNKLRADIFTQLGKFVGRGAVLKITDLNNEVYIIGAPGLPCTISFDGSTGANYTDLNGGKFQFKVEQPFSFFKA